MSGCIRTTSTRCSKQTRREKQQEWVFLCSNLYISVFFSFLSLWIENERVRQSVGSADLSNVSVCPQDTQLYRHVETVTSMLLLMWDSALQIHQTPLIKTVILAHRPPLVSLCETFSLSVQCYRPDWDESNNDVSIFVLLLFKCTSYFSSVSFTSQLIWSNSEPRCK